MVQLLTMSSLTESKHAKTVLTTDVAMVSRILSKSSLQASPWSASGQPEKSLCSIQAKNEPCQHDPQCDASKAWNKKIGVITALLRRQRHEISLSSPNERDETEDVLVEEDMMAKHKAYALTGSKKWPCHICGRKIVNHFWAKRQHLERCQNRHRAPCGECGKKIASNKNAWRQHWQHCPGRLTQASRSRDWTAHHMFHMQVARVGNDEVSRAKIKRNVFQSL